MNETPRKPGEPEPGEPAEVLGRRLEKEQRSTLFQREDELSQSLKPFRVGSVSFLNAVPLTRGLEDQILFTTPANLAQLLQKNELDAGLVSITEVLFSQRYDILDTIAVASLGEVKSVFLAHKKPISEVREIYCDPASLTSVNLLKVLMAEQGLKPEFKPLPSYDFATLPDFTLLIGDTALDFIRTSHNHQIYDLGAAWYEMTRLPFVYAVWALRRGVENKALRQHLREAKDFGLDTLDHIINSHPAYDLEFRKDYLGWHIHYHLGSDEKRGVAKFIELIRKHGLGVVHDPVYVN
jgi:chorismate dehydratase